MGSDYAMNPPAPPPLDIQVRRVMDDRARLVEENRKLREEVKMLKDERESQDRAIARLTVKIEGQPFGNE